MKVFICVDVEYEDQDFSVRRAMVEPDYLAEIIAQDKAVAEIVRNRILERNFDTEVELKAYMQGLNDVLGDGWVIVHPNIVFVLDKIIAGRASPSDLNPNKVRCDNCHWAGMSDDVVDDETCPECGKVGSLMNMMPNPPDKSTVELLRQDAIGLYAAGTGIRIDGDDYIQFNLDTGKIIIRLKATEDEKIAFGQG